MKHDLEKIEISPSSFLHFSWVYFSSEKWVIIYKVYNSVLYNILFDALKHRVIGTLQLYEDGIMSI